MSNQQVSAQRRKYTCTYVFAAGIICTFFDPVKAENPELHQSLVMYATFMD